MHNFRSGFEVEIAEILGSQNIPFQYEDVIFEYYVLRNYTPDFRLTKKDGSDMLIEGKGYFTSADRTKMKLVREHHPDIDLRIWFQQDNWLTKKKKQRYSDWARKNGFKYHVGTKFPKKWKEELLIPSNVDEP